MERSNDRGPRSNSRPRSDGPRRSGGFSGNNDRRSGGFRGNSGPRRDSGFRRNDGPKEMHDATCTKCGKACQVPFKPTEGKPVYCNDCFVRPKRY